MSEKLKIKLSIADRVYPLTVDMSQEEGLRSASKKIDVMIKQFEENYAVRDKQDLLSMAVLHYATAVLKVENKVQDEDTAVAEKVEELDGLLNEFFSQ